MNEQTTNNNKIGIITGHGFPATISLYKEIHLSLSKNNKNLEDKNYPSLITYNSSHDVIPTHGQTINSNELHKELLEAREIFTTPHNTVKYVVNLCNSVHLEDKTIQKIFKPTNIKYLNLPIIVQNHIFNMFSPQNSTILHNENTVFFVLASPITLKNDLYNLAHYSNVHYINKPDFIERACNLDSALAKDYIKYLTNNFFIRTNNMSDKKIVLILGCTDLSYMRCDVLKELDSLSYNNIQVIDSVQVLADVLISL